MFKRMISTEIEIEGGAGRVWEALRDFPSYPEWNSMIRCAEGELKAGAWLRLRYEPAGHAGKNYKPKLLVVDTGNELRWLGNPWIPFCGLTENAEREHLTASYTSIAAPGASASKATC